MLTMRAKLDIHIGPRLNVVKGSIYDIDDACPELGYDVLTYEEHAFLYSTTWQDINRDFEKI